MSEDNGINVLRSFPYSPDGCAVKMAQKGSRAIDIPASLVQGLIDAGYLEGEKSEDYKPSKSRLDPAQSNPAGEANGGSLNGPVRTNLTPNPVTNPHDGSVPEGENGTVVTADADDTDEVTRAELEGLTVKELHEIAERENLDVSEAKRKADLVDLVYAHFQEKPKDPALGDDGDTNNGGEPGQQTKQDD